MSRPRSRARAITATVGFLVALGLLLPPFINANRFRKRLTASTSGALGRSVSLGNVRIRLLPRPGFDIKDFVVGDDPAFSAEPLLRAEQVTATLRFTSLWRGKFEIARLDLKYPSLNLVRNANGEWNIESLLRYTSSLRAAPTSRVKPESNPRFPYIEADSGRINFKILQEKKVYAFADTDFALWLESENQWNMRMEGRPMRTDANLSDTGTVRVEGSMRRGETLEKSALQMHVTLANSQLGQFSSLLSGRDHGWRGNVDVQATAQGTAEKLNIDADAKVADFRRYDIANIEPLFLRTHCSGTVLRTGAISTPPHGTNGPMLSNINCSSAIGTGSITLSGNVALAGDPDFDLKLASSNIPVASLTSLLRKAKRNIPDDLVASGGLSGNIFMRKFGGPPFLKSPSGIPSPTISGSGHASDVRFSSKSLNSDLNVGSISLGFDSVPSGTDALVLVPRLANSTSTRARKLKVPATETVEPTLRIDPFTVLLGERETVSFGGRLGSKSYSLKAKGEGDVAKLIAAARTFGLGNRLPNAEGQASFDIALNGVWAGFAAPAVSGAAQLRRAFTALPGTDSRIHIASANLSLSANEIAVQKLVATLSGTRTTFEGNINIPRSCEKASCPVRFDLRATELNFDDLNRVLNPRLRSSGWRAIGGKFLTASREDASRLLELEAIGTVNANHLLMKSLTANKVTALLEVKRGVVALRNVQGEFLGGHYSGEWSANFTGADPEYTGTGTLEGLGLAQLNSLMRTTVGTGVITRARLKLKLAGSDASTLRRTATGQLSFNWTNGSILAGVDSGKVPPLVFSSWLASSEIAGQKISLTSGSLRTSSGLYTTTGTASFARDLDLRLVSSTQVLSITGTLEAPVVSLREGSTAAEFASNGKDAKPSKTP